MMREFSDPGLEKQPDIEAINVVNSAFMPLSPKEQYSGATLEIGVAGLEPVPPLVIKQSMSVRAVGLRDLDRYVADWDDLARQAVEPNVFYESWMLLPALTTLCRDRDLVFALVFEDFESEQPTRSRLCGFFPLERKKSYRRLPMPVLSLLGHEHCYLRTPLVRSEQVDLTISAFIDWVRRESGCSVFEWRGIGADGGFGRVLSAALARSGLTAFADEDYTRALFRIEDDDDYVPPTMSGKGRREFKRKKQRLAEAGALEYRELNSAGDPDWWVSSFLRLESSGWKGKERTALDCNSPDREFFVETTHRAFVRGALFFSALTLDGIPIAMQCNYLSGNDCFAFKSAFDERYSHYSPGVLLLLDTVTSLSKGRRIRWMDSCTAPDNVMANRLCTDRRRVQTLAMTTGQSAKADVFINVLPKARRMKQWIFDRTPQKLQR